MPHYPCCGVRLRPAAPSAAFCLMGGQGIEPCPNDYEPSALPSELAPPGVLTS